MIILASVSPRRQQLLKLITDDFTVAPQDCDERCIISAPEAHALEIAMRKVRSAALTQSADATIISADTIVSLGDIILEKPIDAPDAVRMLTAMSGKIHTVYTAVCVMHDGQLHSFCEATKVEFYPLSPEHIERYVASGEPMDKAGAYGIQQGGALLVKRIDGDYFNVMGLPIARLYRLLCDLGVTVEGDLP